MTLCRRSKRAGDHVPYHGVSTPCVILLRVTSLAVACDADRMWTHVDACLDVLNTLTDTGMLGGWLRHGSTLCFSLENPGGIYMPSAWMAHLASGCLS
jgi:hypothetical protein